MKFTIRNLFPCLAALVLAIALISGCTDKGTGNDLTTNKNVELRVRVNSSAAVEQVDLFILTISARDMDTIVDTLLFENGAIIGEIEVPVGTQRKFVLEALDMPAEGGEPTLIYRGVTIIDIFPGAVVRLVIDMEPVVPMVRLSPRYAEIESGSVFELDIEAANIPGLAAIDILLDLSSIYNAINPIRVDPHVSQSGSVTAVGQGEFDGLQYRVYVNDTLFRPMVNSDGDGVLATVTFATDGFVSDINVMGNIFIYELAMVDQNQDSIPLLDFQTDFAELVLTSRVDRVINFPDTALMNAVLSYIEANQPPIYFSDIQYLNYFDANEAGIEDWTGLGEMINLEYLVLDYNNAPDLGPLASLIGLSNLSIHGNDLIDIGPLASLVGLTTLDLYWNQIANIGPLSDLTELRALNLSSNLVTGLSPLVPLWKLTDLRLNDNQISSITPLTSLSLMSVLELRNNNITDISPLVENPGLGTGDRIDLSGNPLDDNVQQQLMDSLRTLGATVIYGT